MVEKSEGLYPTLSLLPKAVQLLKGEERIEIVRVLEKKKVAAIPLKAETALSLKLFELLRTLRKQIADEQGIPPYIVFSDRTLHDMARLCPRDAESMLSVSGVGEVKLERYGRQFLCLINRYCNEKQ